MKPSERIREYIDYVGVRQVDLAEISEKDKTTIHRSIGGKVKAFQFEFIDVVNQLCPKINWNWVMTGEGKMDRRS